MLEQRKKQHAFSEGVKVIYVAQGNACYVI
jgi:hypothetical protein